MKHLLVELPVVNLLAKGLNWKNRRGLLWLGLKSLFLRQRSLKLAHLLSHYVINGGDFLTFRIVNEFTILLEVAEVDLRINSLTTVRVV